VSGTDSWQRVNTEIPVKSPRFALFDLAEGKSYCFRVRCCNSAGVGEPSDPTEATTVGDKLGMINTTAFNENVMFLMSCGGESLTLLKKKKFCIAIYGSMKNL